jgi:hypothetical protein
MNSNPKWRDGLAGLVLLMMTTLLWPNGEGDVVADDFGGHPVNRRAEVPIDKERATRARNAEDPPVPAEDRVGFPKGYETMFQVLRTVDRREKQQIVTVFGNDRAASVRSAADLPYPNGSVIVMETSAALKDSDGKSSLDGDGHPRKGDVVGLHVMRREKGFGADYGKNRTGEWEYVEYRADGTYITPPSKSFVCAECHVKAGGERDFVYRGRLPEKLVK